MTEHILFQGDSITDAHRRTDPRGLGGGYVDLVERTLRERGDDVRITNRGVSGDRVAQLRERWQADALDLQPSVLSIFVGVNDTLAAFFDGLPTPLDAFERDYRELLRRSKDAGADRVLLVEPFFVDSTELDPPWRAGGPFVHADLAPRRAVVRRLAERSGAEFVALQAAVDARASERGGAVIAPDGVHPSALGCALIAETWIDAYDKITKR